MAGSNGTSPRLIARRFTSWSFILKIGESARMPVACVSRSRSTPNRRATNRATCEAVSTRIAEIASGVIPAPPDAR